MNLVLCQLENCLTAYVAYRARKLQTPRKLIEEIDSLPDAAPVCPQGQFKMFVRIREANVNDNISKYSGVRVGTSPAMKTEGSKYVPVNINSLDSSNNKRINDMHLTMTSASAGGGSHAVVTVPPLGIASSMTSMPLTPLMSLRKRLDGGGNTKLTSPGAHLGTLVQTSTGRQIIITPSSSGTTVLTSSGQRLTVVKSNLAIQQQQQFHQLQQQTRNDRMPISKPVMKVSPLITTTLQPIASTSTSTATAIAPSAPTPASMNNTQLTSSLALQLKQHSYAAAAPQKPRPDSGNNVTDENDTDSEFAIVETEEMIKERRRQKLQFMAKLNNRKCNAVPMYGADLRNAVQNVFASPSNPNAVSSVSWFAQSHINCCRASTFADNWSLNKCLRSVEQRTEELKYLFENFVLFVPKVSAPTPFLHISHPHPSYLNAEMQRERALTQDISPKLALLHPIISAMSTQFPDPRLIQYDCGKLQTLDRLLRQLKYGQHRVLIFTQMTRMLDVLEAFLNYHGHIYLRLDGSTRIEQRQILMDRFNNDKRIFVFILSTRSGGVGINLTGADTVIFYDSDWNPTMDAQAQDRCHRIGQTRDVNIYRLVSEKTIEENILKKANQKRLLADLSIEGGNFTTAYFKSSSIQELFNVNSGEDNATARLAEVIERDRDRRKCLDENLSATSTTAPGAEASTSTATTVDERSAIGAFESALAEAEDEQDVEAAKIASAEADADLAEFDESIPIEDSESKLPEISKAEQEVENIVKQVSGQNLFWLFHLFIGNRQ